MRALLAAPAVFVAAVIAGAQPTRSIPPSQTIATLEQAVSKRTPGAEAHFWARVQRAGAPLVEPIPGDTSNVLFTFVWHGDSATRNVALVNTAVASYEPAEALLARIPGTDVWHRSYPGRVDARFAYALSVNDNLIPFDQVTDWGARSATFKRDPFNARVFQSGFGPSSRPRSRVSCSAPRATCGSIRRPATTRSPRVALGCPCS